MSTKYVTTVNGKQSFVPTKKVLASGLAGIIVGVIIYVVGNFTDFTLTAEVAAALEVLVMAIVAYFTPPGEAEGVKEVIA